MAERNSFIVRLELMEQLEMLSSEQIGTVFMAMCRYVRDGVAPEFNDPMLKMMFSFVRGQLDRDAEKYEETCRRNAENGKKGGRPRKTQKTERFSEKPKKADCECECDPEPDPDCEPVCEYDPEPVYEYDPEPVREPVRECDPVCEPETACAGSQNTAHTPASINAQTVLQIAEQLGYDWTPKEAEEFLAYNHDRGRTDGWDWAIRKWEQNRPKYSAGRSRKRPAKDTMTPEETAQMNEYLSVMNRFTEDGCFPGA